MNGRNRTTSSESLTLASPPRTQNHDTGTSWTDDLPVCHLSGVGFATNQIYREDGKRQEDHEFEDRSFHFRVDDVFLYGVFDGHNGSNACNFATQRLPAELLFGQLNDVTDCEDIKDILTQAYIAVEKSFFEQMDKQLAERAALLLQVPQGNTPYEAYQQNPDLSTKLQVLEAQIAGGTTALVALILKNKLYVANVGDTRALLVTKGETGQIKVSQLSVDHTINNMDELERLSHLGLDVEFLQQQRRICNSDNTRCIGDYHVKGGRADIEYLRDATGDPVIAEPDVIGGIPIDESCLFLMIMSDGLYHAVQDTTGVEYVNAEIAGMAIEEFATQSTLNGVAQAVVDKVVRKHNDKYLMSLQEKVPSCQKCGDITLLVRQFNIPLPNAIASPTGGGRFYPVTVPFYQARSSNKPSVVIPSASLKLAQLQELRGEMRSPPTSPNTPTNSMLQTQTLSTTLGTTSSTESTQNSGDRRRLFSSRKYQHKLELDQDGRIEAYVDFTEFYNVLNKLNEDQRKTLLQGLEPKTTHDVIPESTSGETTPVIDDPTAAEC